MDSLFMFSFGISFFFVTVNNLFYISLTLGVHDDHPFIYHVGETFCWTVKEFDDLDFNGISCH